MTKVYFSPNFIQGTKKGLLVLYNDKLPTKSKKLKKNNTIALKSFKIKYDRDEIESDSVIFRISNLTKTDIRTKSLIQL